MDNHDFFGRCKICGKDIPIGRDESDPKSAIGCYISWCPDCEDKADCYFEVTSFIYKDRRKSQSKSKDQLKFDFGKKEV